MKIAFLFTFLLLFFSCKTDYVEIIRNETGITFPKNIEVQNYETQSAIGDFSYNINFTIKNSKELKATLKHIKSLKHNKDSLSKSLPKPNRYEFWFMQKTELIYQIAGDYPIIELRIDTITGKSYFQYIDE